MKRIRVLIVEDSPVVREYLRHIVAGDPRLEISAAVASAEEALCVLNDAAPDVISLDIRLPGMNGLDATRAIMMRRPTPIVVLSAAAVVEELQIAMEALRAGALTVLEKPACGTNSEYERMAKRLCTQLVIMSQVKVVRQRFTEPCRVLAPPRVSIPAAAAGRKSLQPCRLGLVGIVCSTGGPSALAELLGGLGGKFSLPVLIVQHMTPSFLEGFASWLASVSPLPVNVAAGGEKMMPGRVYMAPANRHLCVEGGTLRLSDGEPVCCHRPSGDILLHSMARFAGSKALGVVLTGMGSDGAEGLLAIQRAGGYTIAEHPSTAVIYGMPRTAVELGASRESLPLPAIAPRLLQLAGELT